MTVGFKRSTCKVKVGFERSTWKVKVRFERSTWKLKVVFERSTWKVKMSANLERLTLVLVLRVPLTAPHDQIRVPEECVQKCFYLHDPCSKSKNYWLDLLQRVGGCEDDAVVDEGSPACVDLQRILLGGQGLTQVVKWIGWHKLSGGNSHPANDLGLEDGAHVRPFSELGLPSFRPHLEHRCKME